MQRSNDHRPNEPPFLIESESTELQHDTELECQPFFVDLASLKSDQVQHLRQVGLLPPAVTREVPRTAHDHDDNDNNEGSLDVSLIYDKHQHYLSARSLSLTSKLKSSFVSLDSSRPWMIYWCLHSLDLMDRLPKNEDVLCGIVHTLRACWQPLELSVDDLGIQDDPLLAGDLHRHEKTTTTFPAGGFGGGPGQMAHLATTYAAVLSLTILATSDVSSSSSSSSLSDSSSRLAFQLLEEIRLALYVWFHSLKQTSTGAFRMHHDGEVDVRATYCMMACAELLRIGTSELLCDKMTRFVASCQTYEGGFGGEPWSEAHGGYTYCAVAALHLLSSSNQCATTLANTIDLPALRGWLVRRQMAYEGGFQGRNNKLVDGCYSFWQGGALAIVSAQYGKDGGGDPWLTMSASHSSSPPENQQQQRDVPLLFDEGMLQRYILLCAQDVQGGLRDKPSKPRDFYHSCYNLSGLSVSQHCGSMAYGHTTHSRVAMTHPCFNVRVERVHKMMQYNYNSQRADS